MRTLLSDDRGSSAVEFLLVSIVLTALTLGVLQFAVAVYLHNLTHDAAVEGAYFAALADVDVSEGAVRTRAILDRTVGGGFVGSATARLIGQGETAMVEIRVTTHLPLVGFFGIPEAWEVTARAPRESLE